MRFNDRMWLSFANCNFSYLDVTVPWSAAFVIAPVYPAWGLPASVPSHPFPRLDFNNDGKASNLGEINVGRRFTAAPSDISMQYCFANMFIEVNRSLYHRRVNVGSEPLYKNLYYIHFGPHLSRLF